MEIKALVSQMTLEEKAGLCSGLDFWHTKSVERLGVPSVMVSDGPHGLRKQDDKGDHLGINDSIKAVCMPAASATAASFDRDLIRKMGEAIGDSCQHEKLSVVLGPAVNIKRSPLCGRNFEYFSEDPYLAGEMSAAYINGVQSRNVGTSIKHFAANNQETRRLTISSDLSERALHEIYLPAFEEAVKTEIKPKNKDIERMLIGMFTGNYTRSTPEEIIAQLPCGDKAKSALAKKLKGAKFETDRDNLMKIGGFSEQDAGDYAYLYAEAAVWQTFRSVAEMSGADEARLLRCINLGVAVDSSTKIAVT